MAKLTPEEKDSNKAARKERDAAFRARRKAYDTALTAAKDKVAQSELATAKDNACAALDAKIEERSAADRAFRAHIAELEAIHKRGQAMFSVEIDELKVARDKAFKVFRAMEEAQVASVNADYPDMVGVYFAGSWKRPEGV